MRYLKSNGYDVHLRLTNTRPQTAVNRTLTRWISSERYVNPTYVFGKVDSLPEQTYVRMLREQRDLLSSVRALDNNGAKGDEREYHPEQGETLRPSE